MVTIKLAPKNHHHRPTGWAVRFLLACLFCWMLISIHTNASRTITTTRDVKHELLQHSFINDTQFKKTKDTHQTGDFVWKVLPESSALEAPFDFLANPTAVQLVLEKSDMVELNHCNLSRIHWSNFTTWSLPVLREAIRGVKRNKEHRHYFPNRKMETQMTNEFILELLEMYATHQGYCDFGKYHPTVPRNDRAAAPKLKKTSSVSPKEEFARLAIVIVAYQDVLHLKRLVEALYMPHHYIVIHLEHHTTPEFEQQVQEQIVQQYENVVVLKFSTVAYRTDSVSLINFKIMNWLVQDLKLQYDHHVTLGGAVFPLYSAKDLARHLKTQRPHANVWLGRLTNAGILGDNVTSHDNRLRRKRLVYTMDGIKAIPRVASDLIKSNGFDPKIPTEISEAMVYKTNSGNQAVYSYNAVQRLIQSPRVKELFALAKYGCCCCIEERSWIAAMTMVGLKEEALQRGGMFQVWGGEDTCGSSMNNAVLHANASTCYLVEDASAGSRRTKDTPLYIRGNETMSYLKQAKERGFLFARKFHSNHPASTALLDEIRKQVHNHNSLK